MITEHADEQPQNQRIPTAAAIEAAVLLLRYRKHGTLCTSSSRADGWPFGSVVPFALDDRGRPIILVANIAEHTRNIQRDERVSLLVQEEESGDDVQARARLCVMGRARRIPPEDLDDARQRYLRRLPEASDYFATHDFAFYRLDIERLRYIGGFGKIFWLDPEAYGARAS